MCPKVTSVVVNCCTIVCNTYPIILSEDHVRSGVVATPYFSYQSVPMTMSMIATVDRWSLCGLCSQLQVCCIRPGLRLAPIVWDSTKHENAIHLKPCLRNHNTRFSFSTTPFYTSKKKWVHHFLDFPVKTCVTGGSWKICGPKSGAILTGLFLGPLKHTV
jgi:hypothetical protein